MNRMGPLGPRIGDPRIRAPTKARIPGTRWAIISIPGRSVTKWLSLRSPAWLPGASRPMLASFGSFGLVSSEAGEAVTVTTERLKRADLDLYGGEDPRNQPRYTFPEAARATAIPASTLRSWVVGQAYRRKHDQGYFEPVIRRPSTDDPRLSFTNLIEAHVLRALRTVHEVSLGDIRQAIEIAEGKFRIERLLTSPDLLTSAGQLFLDQYTYLLELTEGQQLAMRSVLIQFLQRVEFDDSRLPAEFLPFERSPRNYGRRIITLSPFVSFGRPLLRRTGVSTRAVVQRLEAGESVETVKADYALEDAEIEEAILYEAAA